MTDQERNTFLESISKRQRLKNMSRLKRLIYSPLDTFPFYILATISHIRPYKISFRLPWGKKMISYLPEGNTFYYYGYCEANLTSFLLRYIKPGMVFIDIGAHIGYYTMLASALGAQVHSFEPTPWTFNLLKENTKDLNGVTINNVAISDHKGSVTLADYGPGYGAYNSASSYGGFIKKKSSPVETSSLTIDDYCKEAHIVPDFIKIDAEGLESLILKGLESTINTLMPLITLEMANGDGWAENCAKASKTLLEKGYIAYEMKDDGFLLKHTIKSEYDYTNILFVHKEKTNLISELIK